MPRLDFPLPAPWLATAMAVATALLVATACSTESDRVVGGALSPATDSGTEASGTAPPGVRIPRRFHGEWQGHPGACGKADESRLVIGPESVRFHESEGALQALHADDERLDVALQLRGEGQSWEATYRFRLSDEGRRLTDLSSGNGVVRMRCP